jgi:hypothetical protein
MIPNALFAHALLSAVKMKQSAHNECRADVDGPLGDEQPRVVNQSAMSVGMVTTDPLEK